MLLSDTWKPIDDKGIYMCFDDVLFIWRKAFHAEARVLKYHRYRLTDALFVHFTASV